jgi:PAS domain S-box-containing protein
LDIQTLEKTKQQWQSAADQMPQLICLIDGEGRLLHANRTMEWWRLGSVASVRGRFLHDMLHPGCADPDCYFTQLWQEVANAWQQGRRVELEAFDLQLNRHLRIRSQPLAGPGRDPRRGAGDLHAVVVIDDVSDLKQAEAGVRQRHEELARQVAHEAQQRVLSEEMRARLLTILERTTDFVAMADLSGSLLYLNPAGRAMLGLGATDDLSDRKLCDHADPVVRQALRDEAIPAALANGVWAGESTMRDSAGREIHASQVVIAHRRGDGEVDCISTILRDINERVRTEQALRDSREELRQLSNTLVSIQEDERRRIALDLHDGLGQSLSLIKLAVENTTDLLVERNYEAVFDALQQIVPRLKAALVEVRRVSTELRPSILDDLGILPTLKWFFRELEAVCGRMVIETELGVGEQDVPPRLRITLYRVLQEATSNIVKHAAAGWMRVSLQRDAEALYLTIEDNGRGFDPAAVCAACDRCGTGACRGIGLVSMKERVTLSGGQYRLDSTPGAGTRIHAWWPTSASTLSMTLPTPPSRGG